MSFYAAFSSMYEQVFPFREEVYHFLREYAGPPGGALLDAGCGPGHYGRRFQAEGFRLTGIDLDRKMIESAAAACPEADWRCMDITGIDTLQGPFQMIYSIGNVLAHLPAHSFAAFLAGVYRALPPGGQWITQTVNWDSLLRLEQYTFPVKTFERGRVAFHRSYPFISAERVTFEVRLTSGDETIFHENSTLYPVSSESFIRLHADAGFCCEGLFGGFDGSPYLADRASGVVMVFRKPQVCGQL